MTTVCPLPLPSLPPTPTNDSDGGGGTTGLAGTTHVVIDPKLKYAQLTDVLAH